MIAWAIRSARSAVVAVILGFWMAAAGLAQAPVDGFAGSTACESCHANETKAWSGSHHGWALREPAPANVLGDFNDAGFSHKGVNSRFTKQGGDYFVDTDGPDGKLQRYKVRYTVGVVPLQQYLVETGDGRLQALDIAWDAVANRWYHLYPETDVGAGNGLHWTGSYKNWQARCAECHQTGFDKGFDFRTRAYKSSWTDLTVSCESCHGPSAAHVEAARTGTPMSSLPPVGAMGPGHQETELAVCGPCHARREAFSQVSAPPGSPMGDHYNLSLLSPPLYHLDGQQREEVFIHGSFLQSKMMARGVTCSNCHEPHSGELVAQGDAVCTQCHNEAGRTDFPTLKPKNYESAAHHRHAEGSEAAQCVSCHMPQTSYMMIDGRRDHFFRRPDPAQSKAAGSPDACTGCHTEQTQDWAAERIAEWFPQFERSWQDRSALIDFGGGNGSPAATEALAAYVSDLSRPAIVRASGVEMLAQSGIQAPPSLYPLLNDRSELVRAAAAALLRNADPKVRADSLKPLLSDPSRLVRQAAARELAAGDPSLFEAQDMAQLQKALGEYLDSRQANADMPEAHMAIAGSALGVRRWEAAEAAFKHAAELDPQLEQAWVMLVRLRAALGDPAGSEEYLRQGLAKAPASTGLMFEQANLEARRGDDAKAVEWLRKLLEIDPRRTDAWMQLGYAALRRNDGPAAVDASQRILVLEPGNANAMLLSAVGRYVGGDVTGARAAAEAARRADPSIRLPAEIEGLLAN